MRSLWKILFTDAGKLIDEKHGDDSKIDQEAIETLIQQTNFTEIRRLARFHNVRTFKSSEKERWYWYFKRRGDIYKFSTDGPGFDTEREALAAGVTRARYPLSPKRGDADKTVHHDHLTPKLQVVCGDEAHQWESECLKSHEKIVG